MSDFLFFVLMLPVYLLLLVLYWSLPASLVCLVLGIILTIRSNMHYKTVKRPWLLIVFGFALPVLSVVVVQVILHLVH